MAKLTSPLGSSEARGKCGGVSYNSWRGIAYARSIVNPVTQYSERQLHVRAITKELTQDWQALSDAERSSWNLYATLHIETNVLGSDKRLSGYNWFLRCNFLLLDSEINVKQNHPPSAPLTFFPTSSDIHVFYDEGLSYIWFTYNSYPANAADSCLLDMWLTKPLSAGRKPTIHDATHYGYYVPLQDEPWMSEPITVTGLYGLYFRLFDINSGLRSTWSSDQIFVTVL